MELKDLQKNIKNMEPEELTNLLRNIRQSRRTFKQPAKETVEKKATKAIKTASKKDLFNAVEKLSEEQKKALLEELLSK